MPRRPKRSCPEPPESEGAAGRVGAGQSSSARGSASGALAWLPPDLRAEVRRILAAPMPRGRGCLRYRDAPAHIADSVVRGKKHVVFLSYYPHPALVKKSVVLRESGEYYTTLLACCVREDARAEEFFDQVYEVSSYREMQRWVEQCRASALHPLIHEWIFGVLAVEAARISGVGVVVELNDSMLFLLRDEGALATRIERCLLERADAFLHRMPPRAIEKMRASWALTTPDARTDCLPLRRFFADDLVGEGTSASPRLVFAGGVMPRHIAIERGHEGHLFGPFVETVCRERCELTFYVNQNAREMHWDEHTEYFDLERRYPNFHFRRGVPLHALPRELAGFDFAVYYENHRASSYDPRHFEFNMATKIFSYLEAGLPILVPSSASTMAELVREHGLGIVYEFDTLGATLRALPQSDVAGMRDAVKRYRERNPMAALLPRLRSVYGRAGDRAERSAQSEGEITGRRIPQHWAAPEAIS